MTEPADSERLRAALAAASREPASHVDPGRIFDAVHGRLGAEERRAVVDEIAGDAEAMEVWRLAHELDPGVESREDSPSWVSRWAWMGATAAILLAVGLIWQVVMPWYQAGSPVYRGTDPREIASLLPVDVPLSRDAPILRWTAIDDARYRVRVFTQDLQPLAEASDLTEPRYTVPSDVVSRLPAGAVVLWQVEAEAPEAVIVSPTFTVRLY